MDFDLSSKELRASLKARLEALAAEVDATRRSEGFQEVLRTAARFWSYSPFNQFLITLQRPAATRVTGRRSWEALGRRIREGERPIGVLAPTSNRRGFLFVPVYDLAQTEGRRLPGFKRASRRATRHVRTLERAAAALGLQVAYVEQASGVVGTSHGGRIEVSPRRRGVARAYTLTHELAHELLHQEERQKALTLKRPPPLRTHEEMETEADATAYIVLAALGLDAPTTEYIAWQGGSGALILRSLGRIQRAAKRILEATERGRSRPASPRHAPPGPTLTAMSVGSGH